MSARMGEERHIAVPGVRSAPAPYRLTAEFREPPARFEGCFTTFYHLTLERTDDIAAPAERVTDYLQPEWGNIRFFCGEGPSAAIGGHRVDGARFVGTGPSSLPCRFDLGPVRMWGVGFLPLGWARFIDAEASDCANLVCDGAVHPAFARFRGLDKVLCDPEANHEDQFAAIVAAMDAAMRPARDDARIRRVHSELVEGEHETVTDLADACAMSIRTLERIFQRSFGFAPKLLMRRQRFMRSLTSFMLQRPGRWTEAMDAMYHDQAQFTREFREFMTMNPSEYAALDHPILTSFMEARARIWKSAAQTLDPPSDAG
jgi:AraC-like DNA-binding protein